MKKALITGITGQDGANIAEHLGDIEEERFIALIEREPFLTNPCAVSSKTLFNC